MEKKCVQEQSINEAIRGRGNIETCNEERDKCANS